MMLSATLIGIAMAAVPDEGAFDDTHVKRVAENRLTAVESLWVIPPYVEEWIGRGWDYEKLDRYYHTSDFSVRWVIDSIFKLTALNQDLEERRRHHRFEVDGLFVTMDEKFGWVTVDGTYCAWELWFNGTRLHFGSDTVDRPGDIPESHWTVTHDYSGEVDQWGAEGNIRYRAEIRFHLWFETEDPEF